MKVIQISHTFAGTGYFDTNIENFIDEVKEDISENPEYYSQTEKDNINKLNKKLQDLKPSEKLEFGLFTFNCFDMPEEEYNNLPEFAGW